MISSGLKASEETQLEKLKEEFTEYKKQAEKKRGWASHSDKTDATILQRRFKVWEKRTTGRL